MSAALQKRLAGVERLLGLGVGNGADEVPELDPALLSHWEAVEAWSKCCRRQIWRSVGPELPPLTEDERDEVLEMWNELKQEEQG